ncbi:hypothetical protein B0H13DRAFT_1882079 [Mycena leptocephala]|nr:hypothetical protein B0H13DRAFT_1882079 [Mycena leptocephala]
MDTNAVVFVRDEKRGPSDKLLDRRPEPVHDDKYFFDDGDCMILTEGILFKVHRWALSRDPESMFRNMFAVPQVPHADSEPIQTSGDSPHDFRALLWALYVLPDEIQLQNKHGADIASLVIVANMAHKYSLVTFEAWALGIIWLHCEPGRDYLDGCPQEMLDRVFEAAESGGRQDLCGLVEERHALDFGQKHGRREFLATAYYQQALDMKSFVPSIGNATDFSQSNLTHDQIYRLLSGYCSLSLMLERSYGNYYGNRRTLGDLPSRICDIADHFLGNDWKQKEEDCRFLSLFFKSGAEDDDDAAALNTFGRVSGFAFKGFAGLRGFALNERKRTRTGDCPLMQESSRKWKSWIADKNNSDISQFLDPEVSWHDDSLQTLNVTTVLGSMNEPQEPTQSNLSPAQGAAIWKQYLEPLKGRNIRLGNPTPSGSSNNTGTIRTPPLPKIISPGSIKNSIFRSG